MLSFDTPGPRRRGGGASASLGFSAAKRSVAFSMPDGLIGGRGGKPFRRRISSFSCWFSRLVEASAAFSFSFSSRSRSTSPISPRTSPTNSVRLRRSSESIEKEDIPGLNQASTNAPLPPQNLPRLRHPRSQGARTQIYFLRRQRQSGRTSHRDRQRLQGVEAIADGRRDASGRNRRCASPDL